MNVFYDTALYFFLLGFLGWVCESVFCSIKDRTIVNRGFLNGPLCPIYGVGGMIVICFLNPLGSNIAELFLAGMLTCTVLEYTASFILEKLFRTSWWNYSHIKFNINGRVCLRYSLIFGGLSVMANKLLSPALSVLVSRMPQDVKSWSVWSMLAIFFVDVAATVYSVLQLNGTLAELNKVGAEVKSRLESLQGGNLNLMQRLEKYREDNKERKQAMRESLDEFIQRLESLWNTHRRFRFRRLLKAFPGMKSIKYGEQLSQIKSSFISWTEKRGK